MARKPIELLTRDRCFFCRTSLPDGGHAGYHFCNLTGHRGDLYNNSTIGPPGPCSYGDMLRCPVVGVLDMSSFRDH